MKNAFLDRRVAIQVRGERVVQLLSQLRGEPYVVLIGEPGAGKSTALEYEAIDEGGEIATCREVMNGSPIGKSRTAYLDALDEYRSGDGGKDKLMRLANAISKSNIRRWRLTCRAEDWRATADINAMRRAANNEPIVVAHLLPLSNEEAQLVLASLGESDPERFVGEARNRGARAFLENPLRRAVRQCLKDGDLQVTPDLGVENGFEIVSEIVAGKPAYDSRVILRR